MHRVVATNKELKCFGITDGMKCVMCRENDSFERAFFECQSFKNLCDESHQWFDNLHNTNISLTSLQIFLNLPTVTISLSDKKIKDLRLLLLHVKQYHYERKTIQEKATTSEFISKLIIQLKIDSSLDVTAFPSSQMKMLLRWLKQIFSIQ